MTKTCCLCKCSEFESLPEQTSLLELTTPYEIVCCIHCGLMRLHPQPSLSEYKEHYAESDYYDPAVYDNRAAIRKPLFEGSLDQFQKNAKFDAVQDQIMLDLGSAGGHFLLAAQQRGWRGIGVEISKPLAQSARDRYGLDIYDSLDEVKEGGGGGGCSPCQPRS